MHFFFLLFIVYSQQSYDCYRQNKQQNWLTTEKHLNRTTLYNFYNF